MLCIWAWIYLHIFILRISTFVERVCVLFVLCNDVIRHVTESIHIEYIDIMYHRIGASISDSIPETIANMHQLILSHQIWTWKHTHTRYSLTFLFSWHTNVLPHAHSNSNAQTTHLNRKDLMNKYHNFRTLTRSCCLSMYYTVWIEAMKHATIYCFLLQSKSRERERVCVRVQERGKTVVNCESRKEKCTQRICHYICNKRVENDIFLSMMLSCEQLCNMHE